MKIKIPKRETSEIKIAVPSFFCNKTNSYVVAILSDKDVRVAREDYNIVEVGTSTPFIYGHHLSSVITSDDFTPCTEELFFEIYDRVLNSLSLSPACRDEQVDRVNDIIENQKEFGHE